MMEYLIIRNKEVSRLFDVVAVHFDREEGTIINSAVEYEKAVDLVDFYTSKNGEM